MVKLDTLVLIDCYNADTLGDIDEFDRDQHRIQYSNMVGYLEGLLIETQITDIVYSAYGSNYELFDNGTDLIFKNRAKFPNKRYNRHCCYDINDNIELFENKNILLAGISFYTCIRTRPLGINALADSGVVNSIWSAPEIVGYYGEPKESVDQVLEKTGTPLELNIAKKVNFKQDENWPWRKVELTDNHSVYKCDIINSRNIINTQETK